VISIESVMEESLDLTTGTKHGPWMVISNGSSNKMVEISRQALNDVLELFVVTVRKNIPEELPVQGTTPTYDKEPMRKDTLFVEKKTYSDEATGVSSI
jgi:hypothetical protein